MITLDDQAWEPWSPDELAARLGDWPVPWAVAGGWAIDLWLDRATRPHGDVEIAIPAAGLEAVCDRLGGSGFYAAKDGVLTELAHDRPTLAHQVWVLDLAARKWRLDLLLDPGEDDLWIYRRDARISAPRARVIARTRKGVPYLRPQFVLLFKAKHPRPKDYLDLTVCIDRLSASERRWLFGAVSMAHPDSPWMSRLAESAR